MNWRTTSPIRILFIADKLSFEGSGIHGVTQLFAWWFPRFDSNKFDVTLCSLRGRDEAGEYLEKRGINVHYLSRKKFDPLTFFDLLKLVKEKQPAVLHLHGYGSWTFGRFASILCNIPTVVHEHMVDTNIPIYQRVADRILAFITTSHGIAVSESVKTIMVERRFLSEKRVEVIYNGIPLENFLRKRSPEIKNEAALEWRSKLNIPSKHMVVGTVGRLSRIKGHNYFLEAAAEVLQKFSDITFLIVGDGELRSTLEEKARSLGIEPHVRFAGFCDNAAPLFHLIDILVIASLAEGGPITLFEGMAAGCAVISTNTIGLKEVIAEGKTGFLVPARDGQAIARRICLLLDDEKLLLNVRESAAQESLRFNIDETISKLEECYLRLTKHDS